MDSSLRPSVTSRQSRGSGAVLAVGLTLLTAVLGAVIVLFLDGHGISWLAGLVAGAAAAGLVLGRGRTGARTPAAGAAAQRRTELALLPLQERGWRFVHGVPGPDGPYDHIAVGRGGLILLESLSPDGVVRMRAGEPVVERPGDGAAPPRVKRLRPRALADATTLRERVQRIAERRLWVQAVVVLWSEFPPGCVVDGRCVYIHGSRLAEWMTRRPTQLEEQLAEDVYAAIRELAEHPDELNLPIAV